MKTVISNVIEKPISGEWGNDGGNIKVLRSTNFTNEGRLNLKEVVTRDIDPKKVKSKKLIPGDIIIEKSGGSPNQPVGRVVYFDESDTYLCNNFTSILRPNTNKIYPKYLHYILFCNHKFGGTNSFQNKTTGIINLQLNRYIEEIQIPLPPLATQKKIAAILDAADEYRQKTKTLIEKYDQLAQSLFLDMFGDPVRNEKGWEKKKLEYVCKKITDGTHQSPKFLSSGIPFLFVSNIVDNQINYNTSKFISEEEYLKLTKTTPIEINDILYTSVGSYGNPAIVRENRKFCFQRHIAHLKPNHNIININFLHSMLLTPMVKNQTDVIARGVAQKTMNLREIKSIEIYYPPITIQNQFSERIQLIEAQKQQAQASLQKAEDLFNSLLQRAFNGELVS
jgi:type I restriction enzyme S subunit